MHLLIRLHFPPSQVDVQNGGFKINLEVRPIPSLILIFIHGSISQFNISVNNPNFFSATFDNISAVAMYPVGNTSSMGGGSLSHVKFSSHATTTILFPFTINYQISQDPSLVIAKDIASKCGFDGSTPQDIVVNYVLTVS